MRTDELITWLRDFAELHGEHSVVRANCNEAADRLEELDERNAILLANMDAQWGQGE